MKLKPGFEGKNHRTGLLYKVNEQGYRDDPVDPNAGHIIFLGDSATFCLNLAHEETYPERTEALLGNSCGKLQAMNTGSPGQGTFDGLGFLKKVLQDKSFHVKAVVLGFIHNDISDNFAFDADQKQTREGRSVFKRAVLALKVFRTALYLRGFYHSLRDGAQSGVANMASEPGREVEFDMLTDEQITANKSFQLTLRAIDEIEQLCREAGVPFVFVYLPSGDEEIISGKSARYKKLLEAYFVSHPGIKYLDVLAEYRKYLASIGNPAVLPAAFYSYGRDATHPGKLGAELIAKGLVPLLKSGLGCANAPVTIEVLKDVKIEVGAGGHEARGHLYLGNTTQKPFGLKRGQRFKMVEGLGEGACRIEFGSKLYDLMSCPWLEGVRDPQKDIFRVVKGS